MFMFEEKECVALLSKWHELDLLILLTTKHLEGATK
jgi:hypothetical protein